jgi:beta-galactosidase
MRTVMFFCIFLIAICVQAQIKNSRINFDDNWKFALGNAANPNKDFNYSLETILSKAAEKNNTAASQTFNDSAWTSIQLPHDWVVSLPFVKHPDSEVEAHGYKPIGGFFPENSIGWYRKKFIIPAVDSGARFSITFDGIYRDADIWLNNQYLTKNLSGYIGCTVDITDFINYNQNNVLVVRVNATQYEGWFYEGAGIYRHVWLNKYNNTHIKQDGVFIQTQLKQNTLGKGYNAFLKIETEITNDDYSKQAVFIHQSVIDYSGKIITITKQQPLIINFNQTKTHIQHITLNNTQLWSLESPRQYKLITILKNKQQQTIDSTITKFGCRDIVIDKDKGLFLNGKHIKIKGVCNHQDHAGVGTALPDELQYYRVQLLKEMGANAYRTSHNPPTPELLDACDSLGILVMDETRLLNTSSEYMHQFQQLIKRDRNHPSVFMWSIGNEEHFIQRTSTGKRIAQKMVAIQQQLDPSRTSTFGGNMPNIFSGVNEVIPIRGFNYYLGGIDDYRKQHPNQSIIGTEVGSTVTTRGIYIKDTINAYVPDYDSTFPRWASTAEKWWTMFAEREWLMGGFVWTGFDYRGEPTPYKWPNINSHFGIMDMCGYPKNIYYYYQSWWSNKNVIKLYPHWNHIGNEGKTIQVWCNSNAQQIELFLNEKSLGKKAMPINGHLRWYVVYEPGILKAVGYKNGETFETVVETTTEVVTFKIAPHKDKLVGNGTDVMVYNITAVDAKGREVPTANNLLSFQVIGNAKIIGVGNGNPSSHEADWYADKANWKRSLFNGKCQVIIQAGSQAGIVQLNVHAANLGSTSIKTVVQ